MAVSNIRTFARKMKSLCSLIYSNIRVCFCSIFPDNTINSILRDAFKPLPENKVNHNQIQLIHNGFVRLHLASKKFYTNFFYMAQAHLSNFALQMYKPPNLLRILQYQQKTKNAEDVLNVAS